MRVLRALSGALLWIVATVLGLVAVILCVTVVLLPLGFPLLMLAGRLFGRSVRLFMPREAAHPITEWKKSAEKAPKRLNKTWRKLRHA